MTMSQSGFGKRPPASRPLKCHGPSSQGPIFTGLSYLRPLLLPTWLPGQCQSVENLLDAQCCIRIYARYQEFICEEICVNGSHCRQDVTRAISVSQ